VSITLTDDDYNFQGMFSMSTPSARTGGSLDAMFKISARGSTVRQEIVAGLTTFLAMVYSVIVVPGMLMPEGELWLDWRNPYLLAGLLAIVVAALTRHLLATIALGLLSFFLLRWALGQLPL